MRVIQRRLNWGQLYMVTKTWRLLPTYDDPVCAKWVFLEKLLQLAVSSTLLINWYFSIHVTSTSEHTLCNNSTVIISTIPFFNQYNNVNMLSNGISIYPYMFYSLSYAQLHAYQELADFFVCHLMHLHFVIRTCRKGQSRACHRVTFITLVTYLQSQFSLEERAWLGVKQQNNLW